MFRHQILSICEFAVPWWGPMITKAESEMLERILKTGLHIILEDKYGSFRKALKLTNLQSLAYRRKAIQTKFAKKAEKHKKHKQWFKLRPKTTTRQNNFKYWSVIARTDRLKRSPIPYQTNLLNKHRSK